MNATTVVARNALLGRAHEICGLKPIVHRHVASLKNGRLAMASVDTRATEGEIDLGGVS
jgi:hypothetical protein